MALKKDLPAAKEIKGGGLGWAKKWDENSSLLRGAKPAKKDLWAGKDLKGGKKAK